MGYRGINVARRIHNGSWASKPMKVLEFEILSIKSRCWLDVKGSQSANRRARSVHYVDTYIRYDMTYPCYMYKVSQTTRSI